MKIRKFGFGSTVAVIAVLCASAAASAQQGPGGRFGGERSGPPAPEVIVQRFDRDGSNTVEKEELPGFLSDRLASADQDANGSLSINEIADFFAQRGDGPRDRGPREADRGPEGRRGDGPPPGPGPRP